jgi:hypothetical protein
MRAVSGAEPGRRESLDAVPTATDADAEVDATVTRLETTLEAEAVAEVGNGSGDRSRSCERGVADQRFPRIHDGWFRRP